MATLKDIAAILVKNHQMEQEDADAFLSAVTETILEGLRKDRVVKLKGFGVFKLTSVKDRESINVNTGERVLISGHDKITFTPDAVMRDIVNKPFAQFETVDLTDGVNFDDMPDVELEEEVAKISESIEYDDAPIVKIVEPVTSHENETTADSKLVAEPEIVTEAENIEESKLNPGTEVISEPETESEPEQAVEINPIHESHIEQSEEQTAETVQEEKVPVVPVEELKSTVMEPLQHENEPEVSVESKDTEKVEETEENEEDSYYYDDDEISEYKKTFLIYAIMINIVIAALFFVLGYLAHSKNLLGLENENKAQIDSLIEAGKKDTIVSAPIAQPVRKTENTQKVEEPKENVKPAESAEELNAAEYNKDARVRTGAYRIVGTASTITVRSGQTIKSIARQNLGDGMECYIEAYNGIKSVSAGQKIKIPKLQLKKKTKK